MPESNNNENDEDKETSQSQTKQTDDSQEEESDNAGGIKKEDTDENAESNDNDGDNNEQPEETYDSYRRQYCLTYIRCFFNRHLDDSWFRALYSPAVKYQQALRERQRAAQQAQAFIHAFASPSDSQGAIPRTKDTPDFVKDVRLDRVVLDTSTGDNKSATTPLQDQVPALHAFDSHFLHIHDIPSQVTDEQLLLCLDAKDANMYATTPTKPTGKGPHGDTYIRQAFVEFPSESAIDHVLHQLDRTHGSNVPRKDGDLFFYADVDCSDPYGRLEYDTDGKGGAPPDGLAVPPSKATIRLCKYKASEYCNKAVLLSSVLSSPTRLARDKGSAILLARALDVAKQIPTECRLDEVLEHVNQSSTGPTDGTEDDANILDLAIAYLRRVHLFSFYTCTRADSFASVLAGEQAASNIHLRIKDAEAIDGSDDLLVKRFDEKISKALEEDCNAWINSGAFVVDDQVDQDAATIAQQEQDAIGRWMEDHSILDEDNRARCSFHFCHKLFKDPTFLHKHLLKKHGEYLVGEQAKCHDAYMMKAWDAQEDRNVPDILVDCGNKFGLVPTPVFGREPDCVDPEPERWRAAEERRIRAEEDRQRRREENRNATTSGVNPQKRSAAFVDVDDMKEEKIELSFDNIPDPVKKKKKKKRKLL